MGKVGIKLLGGVAASLAALSACGLHWGVLQSIAWSRMIIEYSGEYGVAAGIRYTFDGNHPCPMCKSIEQAQSESSPADAMRASLAPADLRCTVPASGAAVAPPPAHHRRLREPAAFGGRVADQPLVPPPRQAG
jgi:hypothetical protein